MIYQAKLTRDTTPRPVLFKRDGARTGKQSFSREPQLRTVGKWEVKKIHTCAEVPVLWDREYGAGGVVSGWSPGGVEKAPRRYIDIDKSVPLHRDMVGV